MQRMFFATQLIHIVITASVSLLPGCSRNGSEEGSRAQSHKQGDSIPTRWEVLRIKSHQCQIAFPATPTNKSKKYKNSPYPTSSYMCISDGYIYSLGAQDYSQDPETEPPESLFRHSTNRTNNPMGTVLSIKQIQWNGSPGVDVQYDRDGANFTILRDLVIKDQTYLISISGPGPLKAIQKKADQFFDTFSLIDAD